MSTILGSLLRVDLSRVSAEVLEGLQSGRMILSTSNGNVYWASGSGGSGIVAQLPLVPVSAEELASADQVLKLGQAVKSAQLASIATTAVAATVVVAVVVVATVYLGGKIDRVKSVVDDVSAVVRQQDQREYLGRVSAYAAAIGSARDLLSARPTQAELAMSSSPAATLIAGLAQQREQALNVVAGLPAILSGADSSSAQYQQGLAFLIEVLDWVPAAIAIERELCFAAGQVSLALRRVDHAAHFRERLSHFRTWCDGEFRKVALGGSKHGEVLIAQREALRGLFGSPVHAMLLDGIKAATPQAQASSAPGKALRSAQQRAFEGSAA